MRVVFILGLLIACDGLDATQSQPAAPAAPTPMATPPAAAPEATPEATPEAPEPDELGFRSGGIHCLSREMASCEEGSTLASASPFFRSNCTTFGGTVGEGPCPTENHIGHCTPRFAIGSRMHYYEDDLMRAEDWQDGCVQMGGTWTPTESAQ